MELDKYFDKSFVKNTTKIGPGGKQFGKENISKHSNWLHRQF